MKLRKVIVAAIACVLSAGAVAESADEKIGRAMNEADWFALDSLQRVTPKDSVNPFLEVFSRCLTGNRFNRPEVSIPAFQELLNSQSLDLGNLVSSAHMFGMDLSRVGYNSEAASMLRSIVDQTRQYLDSATIAELSASANRYAALADYKPFEVVMPETGNATVPFTIVPVGPEDKGSVLMHLVSSSINGREADITFDTGAGTNIISPEMAEKYRLIPLEGTMQTVAGIGRRDGYVAIAREMKLGDVVVRDVPFVVVSFSTDNAEADKYIDCFNIVVGSELMLRLKELTIDFANGVISIPAEGPARTDAVPNMCFSAGMNLLARGSVRGVPEFMCIDSGDASFGSLGVAFYEKDKAYVESVGRPDTIRGAGLGGVNIMPAYCVDDLPVTLGGATVRPSGLIVKTRSDGGNEVNLGLRTLMLFGKLRFNMVDFVVSAEQ